MRNINKRDTKVCRQVSQLFWTRSGCQKCRAMISNLYFNNILLPPHHSKIPFLFFGRVRAILSLIIEGGVCYVLLFYVFPANIWLLFCTQSVWSDMVFWKQIKLIPKMHISKRYLKQKCCINNWILSVFCANKLYQFFLFFISGLNRTIS